MSSGKRLFALSLTTLAAAVASAAAHAGTVTSDGQDLVIKSKGGLEVGTVDKAYTFKVGGRLQLITTRITTYSTSLALAKMPITSPIKVQLTACTFVAASWSFQAL